MVETESLDKGVGTEAEPAGASAPASSPAPPGPASPPEKRKAGRPVGTTGTPWRKMSAEELDALLTLMAAAVDIDRIAAILGMRPARIRAVAAKHPKRLAYLREERLKLEVEHAIEMTRMLPKSREVLTKTLDYGSEKERVSTAKWVHEKLLPPPVHRSEVTVEAKVEHNLRPLAEQMVEHLKVLRERVETRDPLARVKVGTAALVRQQLGSGE